MLKSHSDRICCIANTNRKIGIATKKNYLPTYQWPTRLKTVLKTKYNQSSSSFLCDVKIQTCIVTLAMMVESIMHIRLHMSHTLLKEIHSGLKALLATAKGILDVDDMTLVMLDVIKKTYHLIAITIMMLGLLVNSCMNDLNPSFQVVKGWW